jgi:hypothetical protein
MVLVHVPPNVLFVKVILVPGQTDEDPPMDAGSAFTVSIRVRKHPVDKV